MSAIRRFPLEGARRRHPEVAQWLAAQPASLGEIARYWFEALRQSGDDVTEVMHDGQATACVGDLALGYVAVFTRHVNVGFYLGSSLPDPCGLLVGAGKFMRHVPVRAGAKPPADALHALVSASYREMKARCRA